MEDLNNPNTSPNILAKEDTSQGVRKLNKWPIIIIIAAIIIIFISLAIAMGNRGNLHKTVNEEEKETTIVTQNINPMIDEMIEQSKDNTVKPKEELAATPIEIKKETIVYKDPLGKPVKPIIPSISEDEKKLKELKAKLLLDAITSPTGMQSLNSGLNTTQNNQNLNTTNEDNYNSNPSYNRLENLLNPKPKDLKTSNEKFMERQSKDYSYINTMKTPQITPFEIKSGTIIPGVLITGINSELPGQILGQVSENVYDTASGNYLLIPQGTKMIGIYSDNVTYGQNRALIAWNRLIFPDGKTINIGSMNGTDKAGYAGFEDKVNNHYFRIFGSAFLLSMLGGEIKLDDGKLTIVSGQSSNDNETVIEKTAGAMIQKNLGIAPTIEIRPGYKFNIFVTKDMILEPLEY